LWRRLARGVPGLWTENVAQGAGAHRPAVRPHAAGQRQPGYPGPHRRPRPDAAFGLAQGSLGQPQRRAHGPLDRLAGWENLCKDRGALGGGAARARRVRVRPASVPIPKFASARRSLRANFGIERTLANIMMLVPLLNPKFATVPAEKSCELRVRGTSGLALVDSCGRFCYRRA